MYIKKILKEIFLQRKNASEIHSSYDSARSPLFHQVSVEKEHHVILFYGFP